LSRAIAMMQAGIFLSHPPIVTSPSNPWHPATVSIESAMTSLDTSEYFIPSVPIEIPSEMVMVLKITAFPPAASAPPAASRASLSICMLHGVTMLHVEAIPICDFLKSRLVNPTACSIARLGARSTPSTTMAECSRFVIGLETGPRPVLRFGGSAGIRVCQPMGLQPN